MPDNLLLKPQPPLSPGESFTHRPDNLLLQLHSSIRRTTRLSKEWMMVANHTQARDFMATTTHSYNTHGIDNLSGFTKDVGRLLRWMAMQRSSVETKWFSGRIPVNSGGVWKVHQMTQMMDFGSQIHVWTLQRMNTEATKFKGIHQLTFGSGFQDCVTGKLSKGHSWTPTVQTTNGKMEDELPSQLNSWGKLHVLGLTHVSHEDACTQ